MGFSPIYWFPSLIEFKFLFVAVDVSSQTFRPKSIKGRGCSEDWNVFSFPYVD